MLSNVQLEHIKHKNKFSRNNSTGCHSNENFIPLKWSGKIVFELKIIRTEMVLCKTLDIVVRNKNCCKIFVVIFVNDFIRNFHEMFVTASLSLPLFKCRVTL